MFVGRSGSKPFPVHPQHFPHTHPSILKAMGLTNASAIHSEKCSETARNALN